MRTFTDKTKIYEIDTKKEFICLEVWEWFRFKDWDILEYIKEENNNRSNIPLMKRKSDWYTSYIPLYKIYYNEWQIINNDYMQYISDDDLEIK